MKNIIMLHGLTKQYGSLLAADHVSLNIEEGFMVVHFRQAKTCHQQHQKQQR